MLSAGKSAGGPVSTVPVPEPEKNFECVRNSSGHWKAGFEKIIGLHSPMHAA